MATGNASDSTSDVSKLQSSLLSSVVHQVPLSGQQVVPHFPDLAFILESPKILVSDENVSGKLHLDDLGRPADIVPEQRILEEARSAGDVPYVRFRTPEVREGRIRITMEVRMAASQAAVTPLGLGAITAIFVRRQDGTWEVAEPPQSVAF